MAMLHDSITDLAERRECHEWRLASPTAIGEIINEAIIAIEVAPARYLDNVGMEGEQVFKHGHSEVHFRSREDSSHFSEGLIEGPPCQRGGQSGISELPCELLCEAWLWWSAVDASWRTTDRRAS